MFHSVGLENYPWAWSYISESLETFEAKIVLLKDTGFNSVTWSELYEHMAGRQILPEKSILLTFDDGYLDNWVYVYPILKKYGMKGTIFVSPDFVDPLSDVRPNLVDVTARQNVCDELTVAGFLSWAEMLEMEKSGVMDIQSHAMTHTWYFSGPKIVDYHVPHEIAPHPWLFWNVRPDRKPYYLAEDQQEFLPWGYPILEHHKSLTAKRYFPDEDAICEITNFVAENGGREYFQRPDWRPTLKSWVENIFDDGRLPGYYETDDSRISRITDELTLSKALIERNLGKQVDYICWPGGANDETVLALAKTQGYKSWTLSSDSNVEKRNCPGIDPSNIKRIGTSNVIDVRGRNCGTGGPYFQLLRILGHQGSVFHSAAIRVYKLVALILSFVRPK